MVVSGVLLASGVLAAPATASVVPSPGLPSSGVADPDGVSLRLKPLATGLAAPLLVTTAAEGRPRLYVVERAGRIRIFVSGDVRSRPYLGIRDRVNASGGEQGLLGLAFSPRFATDRHLWVSYTDSAGALQVSRFTASSPTAAPRVGARPRSRSFAFRIPTNTNHNAGMLVFGKDDQLYISTGDGGGAGDPSANAQDRTNLSGKILRINPYRSCGTKHYCIPSSNPYAAPGGARGEIWLYGLRNPWRFSADRATGDLWIGDVGQSSFEEVTRVPYGALGLEPRLVLPRGALGLQRRALLGRTHVPRPDDRLRTQRRERRSSAGTSTAGPAMRDLLGGSVRLRRLHHREPLGRRARVRRFWSARSAPTG